MVLSLHRGGGNVAFPVVPQRPLQIFPVTEKEADFQKKKKNLFVGVFEN